MVLGTPLYMSPEQARGDEDLDQRIDIWALGVILYECLTAEVPFRATNYLGVISQVLNQEVTPPRKLRPEMRISEAMERVVGKAMARDRDDRYPSMAALIDDLDRVASGGEVEPPRTTAAAGERSRPTLLSGRGRRARGHGGAARDRSLHARAGARGRRRIRRP